MNDRPSASELLEAVRRFLQDDVVDALDGHLKYQARVAANVVAIVGRELETEDSQLRGEWQRLAALLGTEAALPADRGVLKREIRARNEELVERIRGGHADAGAWRGEVVAHLRTTVADKLTVAKSPRP